MKTNILLTLFIACSFFCNGKNGVTRIDMSHYQTICFDSLVTNISCTKLENKLFEQCIDMIQHKDFLYFMGSTIAGKSVTIYKNTGAFIKELTFSDALLVNSMCVIPELEELWVVSRFKIINKFKLDGTLIKRVSLPFPCANIIPTDKHDFLVYSGGTCNERGNIEGHFMALTDFKSINKLFMPMQGKNEWPYTPYNLHTTDTNNNIFIFPPRIDTIYSYNFQQKELYPLYSLDFHGDFLKSDKGFEDHEMHEIITKRTYIHNRYSFYQASGKLFFKLKGKREDFCFINLKDHLLYSFDRLFDQFQSRFINPFVGSYKDKLYLLVWEKDLAEHYQNIKCNYPAIRKILPSLSTDNSNWILITIDIKK